MVSRLKPQVKQKYKGNQDFTEVPKSSDEVQRSIWDRSQTILINF